jgi:hypothetical protein
MPNAPSAPPGGNPPSAALQEMTELLTALASYSAAARKLLESETAEGGSRLAELLDKIFAEAGQASEIVLRLRRLLPADPSDAPDRSAPDA